MNPAPAHLEAKLRFWEFTVGQIAAAFVGMLIGLVWAKFLCPFDGMWAALSGTYIAALPVVPVFVASQTEFDLWGLVCGALRWRRLDGRYVPGAGSAPGGLSAHARRSRPRGGRQSAQLRSRRSGAVGRRMTAA